MIVVVIVIVTIIVVVIAIVVVFIGVITVCCSWFYRRLCFLRCYYLFILLLLLHYSTSASLRSRPLYRDDSHVIIDFIKTLLHFFFYFRSGHLQVYFFNFIFPLSWKPVWTWYRGLFLCRGPHSFRLFFCFFSVYLCFILFSVWYIFFLPLPLYLFLFLSLFTTLEAIVTKIMVLPNLIEFKKYLYEHMKPKSGFYHRLRIRCLNGGLFDPEITWLFMSPVRSGFSSAHFEKRRGTGRGHWLRKGGV